jgi:Xaa-Pro aminopeptidase
MKNQLSALMQAKQIDAILVIGPAQHNPPMVYLTGGAHITDGHLLIVQGHDPLLVHYPMERDEAASTGLRTRSLDEYDYRKLLKAAQGDEARYRVMLYKTILAEQGFTSGNLAIYGLVDAGLAYATFTGLQKELPNVNICKEAGESLLSQARVFKDLEEIEHIRATGQATVAVVGRVADFLSSQRVKGLTLYKKDGLPLTVGDVKAKINLWIAELGYENPEQTIFAIGRDGGVPHSTGNPEDVIRLGVPIVFDIFPCEAGGGYFYDLTRTWCLGFATDETQKLYEDVRRVFDQINQELAVGERCNYYQELVCDLFEAMGYPTIRSDPKTPDGYIHSLGHGVGLDYHEAPWFRDSVEGGDTLQPNMVFTIEPGLYFPERGMGVRIEDTLWISPQGKIEALAKYPYDLVLPVKS